MLNVGGLILAAGESARLGRPKQLIQFRGRTLVRRVVDAAIAADCCPIVAVVGSDRDKVASELEQTAALVVENQNWRNGIGSSIRRGIRRLTNAVPELEAVVLLVCDQPFVNAMLIKRLILRRNESGKPIIACSYADTLGVPALFDRIFFEELLTLPDDCGAKAIILRNRDTVAEVPFPEGKIDIDTGEDREKLVAQQNAGD